jgi:phage-related protein
MKRLHWVSSSKKCLDDFPDDIREEIGYTLYLAQIGDKGINAIPMVGFGGASVLEVIIDDCGEAYRSVYTVRFPEAVYVLHAFQKKSRHGISTPKPDMNLIRSRLRLAERHHAENYGKGWTKGKTSWPTILKSLRMR